MFSTGSTNVSQPTESGHPSHVTSTLYKNETSEEIEEDGELPCGPELAEFLKACMLINFSARTGKTQRIFSLRVYGTVT